MLDTSEWASGVGNRAAKDKASTDKHQRCLWCFSVTTLPSATVVGLWVTTPIVGHEMERVNGVGNRAADDSVVFKKCTRGVSGAF